MVWAEAGGGTWFIVPSYWLNTRVPNFDIDTVSISKYAEKEPSDTLLKVSAID